MSEKWHPDYQRFVDEHTRQGTYALNARSAPYLDRAGYRRMEPRAETRSSPELVLSGWIPAEPLINATSKVAAFGSCFAYNFIDWLHARGYFQESIDSMLSDLVRNPFEHVAAISQHLRWAFGELPPNTAMWFGKNKQLVEPTEDQRCALRSTLEAADVLILTLGLSEYWLDGQTNESLWRVPPENVFNNDRWRFEILSVSETVDHLRVIERLRSQYMPKLKIIFTVSPLRLGGTFRPVSPITANSASKAIIRAALDEFLRSVPELFNTTYYYFPSYELALDVAPDAHASDNMHLKSEHIQTILQIFAKYYTDIGDDSDQVEVGAFHETNNSEFQEVSDKLEEVTTWAKVLERERDRLQADVEVASAALVEAAAARRWDQRLAGAYARRGMKASAQIVAARLLPYGKSAGRTRRTVDVETESGRLQLFADDSVMLPSMQMYGTWEPEEAAFITSLLRPGGGFLDVGANVGYHTIAGLRAVGPTGRVVAVEVDRRLQPLQRLNVERNVDFDTRRAFRSVPAAAWNSLALLGMSKGGTNSGDQRVHADIKPGRGRVVGLPLDMLLPFWRRSGVAVIKTDLQGRDHIALRGLQRTIRKYNPVVISEFWPEGIKEIGDDPRTALREWPIGTQLGILESPSVSLGSVSDEAWLDEIHNAVVGSVEGYVTLVAVPSGVVLPAITW